MPSFVCPFCVTNRCFVSFAKYFQHITIYHQHEPNFKISCDLRNDCGVLHRTFSAFKSHVYRKHSLELHSNESIGDLNDIPHENQRRDSQTISDAELGTNSDDGGVFDDNDGEILLDDAYQTFCNPTSLFDPVNCDESFADLLALLKKSYISFILELREEYLLPKSVMNIISTYIVTLVRHLHVLLKKKTSNVHMNCCSSSTTDVSKRNETVIRLDEVQQTIDITCEVIESVARNEYQFIKNCEKYFDYSEAEEIIISAADEPLESAYFIPIDKTLTAMLKSKALFLEIQESIQQQRTAVERDDDLMFSIRDGYCGSRLDDESLLLQLYTDDIGLTNPIGPKRNMHKMCMVYFSLEDLPDKYRSKVDFIQMVAICKSKILKNPDQTQRFFQPIIDNLNQLQIHGLRVNGIHVKISFSTVVADNLASHFVGAFQSCFSNGYFCRRCYMTYSEKNTPASISRIRTRGMIDHDDLVHQIVNDPNNLPIKGVVGPSPLRQLSGFHPTTSLPGDVMHDFLEGVCPMIIMCLLKQASSLRLLTYSRIQSRMESFCYGKFDSRNQPPAILAKHFQNNHIVGTASQKLCLFKLFPIIFYDIVDRLPSFIVYKVLREILDLVLSHPFRKKWLPTLGELCDEFHTVMLDHFPDRITPKTHFIQEYKQIISDFGPAVKQWCIRYEARHLYFKRITMRTNNFKNIPKMLATRYRLKQCLTFHHLSRLPCSQHSVGIKKIRNKSFNMPMKNIVRQHFNLHELEDDLYQCDKLVYENVEYCRAGVYVTGLKPSHEQPVFEQIMFILKMDVKWWFLVDTLETVLYNEKLFAWEVQSKDRYSMVDPNELTYYYKGLDIYIVNNSSYVSFTSRLTFH